MKKLLKSEICGFMNNAQMHCSLGKVNICGYCSLNSSRIPPKTRENKKKKKKNEKNEIAASPKRRRSLSAIQTSTKTCRVVTVNAAAAFLSKKQVPAFDM